MRRICLFFLILIVTFSIISCEDFFEEEQTETKVSLSNCSIEDVLRKDYGSEELLKKNLLDYAVFNDYKRSDSDEQTEIIEFIDAFYGSSEDSVKAKGLSSSKGSIKLTKVDSRECAVYEEQSTQKGLSASFPVAGNVSIDVYDVINESTGKTQFVIIPNDKRIGNVLYISDGSNWEAEKDSEPMKYFMEGFVEYAKEVMAKWDEITPEEVEKKAEEFGFTGTKDMTFDSLNYRRYTNWKQVGGDSSIIKTPEFEQNGFYNDVIASYYGKDYLVGCMCLSSGIIMNHWRWPQKFIDVNDTNATLEKVKSCYTSLADWDGVYDWDGIHKVSNKDHLAAMLFDIAEACGVDYGTEGTGGQHDCVDRGLNSMGFSYSFIDDSEFGTDALLAVVSSLKNGIPCIIADTTHAFNTDGFRMMQRECVVRRYSIGSEFKHEDVTLTDQQDVYFHMNMGWGGSNNGWCEPSRVPLGHRFRFIWHNIMPNEEFTHEDVSLTFSANDGSGVDVVKTIKSNTRNNLSDFGKIGFHAPEGKYFVCWNTKANGTGTPYAPTDDINIPRDAKLYAIWKDSAFDYDVFFETGYMPTGVIKANGTPIEVRVKYPKGTVFTHEGAVEGNAYYGYYHKANVGDAVYAPFNTENYVKNSYGFLNEFLGGGNDFIYYSHDYNKSGVLTHGLIKGSSSYTGNTNAWNIVTVNMKETFELWESLVEI